MLQQGYGQHLAGAFEHSKRDLSARILVLVRYRHAEVGALPQTVGPDLPMHAPHFVKSAVPALRKDYRPAERQQELSSIAGAEVLRTRSLIVPDLHLHPLLG